MCNGYSLKFGGIESVKDVYGRIYQYSQTHRLKRKYQLTAKTTTTTEIDHGNELTSNIGISFGFQHTVIVVLNESS